MYIEINIKNKLNDKAKDFLIKELRDSILNSLIDLDFRRKDISFKIDFLNEMDDLENEVIAIDQDFQDRMAEEIKPIIDHEIEGTREMD